MHLAPRFGVTSDKIPSDLLDLVDGLHFSHPCEQGADDLETTLKAVEEQFGAYLHQVKWLNMGTDTTSQERTMM